MRRTTLSLTFMAIPLCQLLLTGCSGHGEKTRACAEQLEARIHLAAQAYDWKSVVIKGNGYIDGIVYSKAASGVAYINTDMGGAYRLDPATNIWTPLTDWIQINDAIQNNGAQTIAVDPTDPSRVYLVAGTYGSSAAFLRSSDQGRTWQRTNVSTIKVDGNGWGRNVGQRLMVDPNKPDNLYYGAQYYSASASGLWKSTDYGATWAKVSFPALGDIWNGNYSNANGIGLPFVLADRTSSTPGTASRTMYVGVATTVNTSGKIYRTTDGGATWIAIPNQPALAYTPNRAVLTPDGSALYIAYSNQSGPYGATAGALYKVTNPSSANPTWTNVTPSSGPYSAVALDPTDSNTLYAAVFDRYPDNIYRSTNGGTSWTALNPQSHLDNSSASYASSLSTHWLTDLQVDPNNRNVAMYVTGYGLFRTTNLTAAAPTWSFYNEGFEQTATSEIVSPSSGSVHLITAIGDRDGFRHENLDASPSLGRHGQNTGVAFGSCDDIDVAWNDPNHLIRTGHTSPWVQYSTDNGVTWRWFSATNTAGSGNGGNWVAMSADGLYSLYEPGDTGRVRYAVRSGTNWGTWTNPTVNQPVDGALIVADLADAHTFYAYVGTTVSMSTDGGASWTVKTNSAPGSGEWIRAVPGNAGHLLMTRRTGGLWRSTDRGATWTRINSSALTVANQVGVGAAAPGKSYPSIYVGGTVAGQNGFFRSDDEGASWTMINDLSHHYGWVTVIQGDPRIHGRLYVGTNGRGFFYADPHATPAMPEGWTSVDIGTPGSTGSAGESGGAWEVIGGGAGISGAADQFHFAYQTLQGDGTIVGQVTGVPLASPANNNARAGVMIRETLNGGSANLFVALTPGSVNGVVASSRTTSGGSTTSTNVTDGVYPPYWVKLVRQGRSFTAHYSKDGSSWTQLGATQTINMAQTVFIGLASTANDNNQLNRATFKNVSIQRDTTPPTINSASFLWQDSPNQIAVSFGEDVLASLQTSDLRVINSAGNSVEVLSFTYDSQNTAIFSLAQPLVDDDYLATVLKEGVQDNSGNSLAADYPIPFFSLGADFSRDRKVNTQDFNLLAASFGGSGDFSHGNANYDGCVDSVDFSILLNQYGKSLTSTVPAPVAPLFSDFRAESSELDGATLEEVGFRP